MTTANERLTPMRSIALALGLSAALWAPAAPAQQSINANALLLGAVRGNNPARVTALLDEGAAINSRNRLGDSGLLLAAKSGNTPMALLLLERGADVNQANLSGVSPLMAPRLRADVGPAKARLSWPPG